MSEDAAQQPNQSKADELLAKSGEFQTIPDTKILDLADAAFMKNHRQLKTITDDLLDQGDRLIAQQAALTQVHNERLQGIKDLLDKVGTNNSATFPEQS